MSSIQAIAAEARGFVKAGKNAEERGDLSGAREFYLRAAKLFNEASALSSDKMEQNTQRELAKYYYTRARNLNNTRTSKTRRESTDTAEEFIITEKPNVGFNDIGGLEGVKEELKRAIIYPFTHKDVYEYYNKKSGGGVLLYGPPGCGKTLMAKAVAGECDADFLNVETSTIMSKWVGESEKSIKTVFNAARKLDRAIIFFDEFDAIGVKRSETEDYVKRIVNELLMQMDGMEENENILVLAATNEPWAIDPALRRPGRFNKMIFIPPPDFGARCEIFNLYLKHLPIEEDVDTSHLATLTQGYSGADIKAVCEDAAEQPLQEALEGRGIRRITFQDFTKAIKARRSSIGSWIHTAVGQIKKSGEEKLFEDVLKIAGDY